MSTRRAVIFMHGLGDVGRSWSPIASELSSLPAATTQWKFPDAPVQPVSVNQGMRMTSWFDIHDVPVSLGTKVPSSDVDASVKRAHDMVAELEASGIESKNIFVGGFSQGGAIALQSVYRYPRQLAGAIVLSGWMIEPERFAERLTDANKNTPLFWGHGGSDPMVLPETQTAGVAKLKELGINVEPHTYANMGHSSCGQEIVDLDNWLGQITKE